MVQFSELKFHFISWFFFFFFEILPIIGIDIVKPNQSFQKLLRLISLFKIHLCNICHICNGVLAEGGDAKKYFCLLFLALYWGNSESAETLC